MNRFAAAAGIAIALSGCTYLPTREDLAALPDVVERTYPGPYESAAFRTSSNLLSCLGGNQAIGLQVLDLDKGPGFMTSAAVLGDLYVVVEYRNEADRLKVRFRHDQRRLMSNPWVNRFAAQFDYWSRGEMLGECWWSKFPYPEGFERQREQREGNRP